MSQNEKGKRQKRYEGVAGKMGHDFRLQSIRTPASKAALGKIVRSMFRVLGAKPKSAPPSTIDSTQSILRKTYEEIGHFLFSHRLDLTPLNFSCAHDYVVGAERSMIDDVDGAIRERRLSNGWIEDYLARKDSHLVKPEVMQEVTARLEGELRQCLDLLETSAEQQKGCQSDLESSLYISSPEDLLAHLRDLTGRMIEQNRLAERELRQSHSRMNQLHTTLRSARQASKHDHLTGLPNRRGFERIVEAWRGSEGSTGAVLAICDIDHFKSVNDRFGHDTGDRVLQLVAEELRALAERKHEVARFGGEEFVILMPRLSLEQAAFDVDLIRQSLASRNLVHRETDIPIGAVTFSAGLAAFYRTDAFANVLQRADAALYAAKHAGRNRVHGVTENGQIYPLRW